MPVIRMSFSRTSKAILGALSLVALGTVVLIAFELLRRPSYDKEDPDYRQYSQTFDHLAGELARREVSSEDIIDLGSLNDGDWETACVFGGYNDPLDEMRSYGAEISEADQRRLTDAKSGFRLNQVEEYEMMIAYVDTRNRAHFIHFERGIGPGGQHLRKCISKPDTKVILDGMISLAPATDLRVKAVSIDADRLSVELIDGRAISVPLVWFPRLFNATPEQRARWELAGGGYGIHWPEIDEDLSTEGMLRGAPAPVGTLA